MITEADDKRLRALGLRGVTKKGNPYSMHLLPSDSTVALCGSMLGNGSRVGWYVFSVYEQPGAPCCEKCLKMAEFL